MVRGIAAERFSSAGFRHEAVILQPEADAPFLVVHTDIHAEDHVGREDGRTLYHIVHIVADVMRAAVPRASFPISSTLQRTPASTRRSAL